MTATPEAIEVLELEAAAIQDAQPAAADFLELVAASFGLLPAGVPLVAAVQHGRRRTGRPPFLARHDPRVCPDSVRLPQAQRGNTRRRDRDELATARRRIPHRDHET